MLLLSEEPEAFYRGHDLFLDALGRNVQNPLKFHLAQLRSVGVARSGPGTSEVGRSTGSPSVATRRGPEPRRPTDTEGVRSYPPARRRVSPGTGNALTCALSRPSRTRSSPNSNSLP